MKGLYRYEYKTVDLYAHDPMLKMTPYEFGRTRTRNKFRMEEKGWELVKQENSIALFRRQVLAF